MEEPTNTGSTVAAAERRGHMRENASHRGRSASTSSGASWSHAESSAMKVRVPRRIS